MRGICAGLQIFLNHGGTYVSAEHDEIRAGQKSGEHLSELEIETLHENGWNNDSEFCHCERAYTNKEVNHDTSCNAWYTFC